MNDEGRNEWPTVPLWRDTVKDGGEMRKSVKRKKKMGKRLRKTSGKKERGEERESQGTGELPDLPPGVTQ